MATSSEGALERAIVTAIGQAISEIVEEEARTAAERVDRRIRERTAGVAASVLEQFSMERIGRDLVIRIRHDTKAD